MLDNAASTENQELLKVTEAQVSCDYGDLSKASQLLSSIHSMIHTLQFECIFCHPVSCWENKQVSYLVKELLIGVMRVSVFLCLATLRLQGVCRAFCLACLENRDRETSHRLVI